MKIEFLTQQDSLYILPFFEEFIRSYSEQFEIVRISYCRAMGKRPRKQLLRELMWLYGVPGLARLLLEAGKARILGFLPRCRWAVRFYSIAQLARAYGIDCEFVADPNQASYASGLRQRSPELLVSVACPYILKRHVLEIPSRGCINIHHAPLPRFKGMMPTFWQMYHGEPQLGVTVHTMAAQVDEGEVLLQESLPVVPGETLHNLIRKSKRHGAHCVAHVLRSIERGAVAAVRMDQNQATYFTFPRKEEALEFRRRGFRAI
jgi:methionyl-tRNA formyltransferase